MAQSDSEISENVQLETFSELETELQQLGASKQSANSDFEVGDTICAIANPTVEGLIIGKWEAPNGKIEVVILLPGYKKKGHAPCFASVIRKDIEKVSKRRVRKYAFPLANLEKWQTCIKKHKKDLSWTANAIQSLNEADQEYIVELNNNAHHQENTRNSLSLNSPQNDTRNGEVIHGNSTSNMRPRSSNSNEKTTSFADFPLYTNSSESDMSTKHRSKGRRIRRNSKSKKYKRPLKKYRKAKKAKRSSRKSSDTSDDEESTSSSSNASYLSDSTSSEESECPFSRHDKRGNHHLKARIKGKMEERKIIRYALHNLYSSYSSLKCVVNDIRSRSLAVGTKPLTFDLIWLEQHAIYLDMIMFESFRGVWKLWNEPVVDELTLAFLELLVRVSPRKEYSDRLDERVRKWMKKRRIGVSQRYGPVPTYLQQTKITEAGILANNNFSQRRWAASTYDRPYFNNNTSNNNNNFKSNARGFQQTNQKQNGIQPNKPSVPQQNQ